MVLQLLGSDLALGRGYSLVFALEVEYKPLDQTNMRYGGDAS
jgi:hypothetical protein